MLGPGAGVRHAAEDLLRRWNDLVSVRAEGADLRLPALAEPFRDELRENAERLAAEAGIEIEFIRKRNFRKEDRVKEISDPARRASGTGVRVVGHGALLDLQTMARQANRPELPEARRRQVSALLLLLHRRRTGSVLCVGTGLPNRTLLEDRIAIALGGARRRKEGIAFLFLDLDRFKIVNDTLGHSVGDILLQEVAERLKKWVREQDTVARVGGDEFVIMLAGIQSASEAVAAAERLVDLIAAGFSIHDHSLNITCSVGISIFPESGMDGETLVKHADAAMYSAKQKGPNNVGFFTEDLNLQMVERLRLESGLRHAIDRNELYLVYQPQMDLATERIVGVEALLRWQHPELGMVPPDKFIGIAENCGLIVPIGEWVLRTACAQARKWQDEGLPAVPIAVNVSAVQFRQDGFRDLIKNVLHETGLPPQYLELELTESLLLTNADVMFSVLRELNEMGLNLAIDDFGTGYSSLSYLKQFPVKKLKIDRSFIRNVALNQSDAAITTAIIGMAKSLGLKVLAEGVENKAQMSFLREHRCDEIQGYYFSKPITAGEVADKLIYAQAGEYLRTTQGSLPADSLVF